ncbi:MAG: hypothetical protein IKL48_03000 [Elusimicrobiaceae bacterium]|nr:hypothetical protein [Elusimicrobiaceae bacterium]
MTKLHIESIAYELPDRYILSNELDEKCQTPIGYTEEHIGIKSRYYFDKKTVLAGGAAAAQKAVEQAGLTWKDIDCMVAASATKWQPIPCMAACLKQELGVSDYTFPCFDIDSTCLSFMVAVDTLACGLESGKYKHVLVVSAEQPSGVINWNQPKSACLFGDMAVAAVLGRGNADKPFFSCFSTHIQGADFARIKGGQLAQLPTLYTPQNHNDYLFDMNGRSIYKVSAKVLPGFIENAFKQTGLAWKDIAMVIPHQASPLAMTLMSKKLGIPLEKMMFTIQDYGNNVAAAIPFAFAKAIEQGKIKRGDKVMLLGTSAGLSIGMMILEY